MGNALKNPPVYFVIAQVRFNPILQLERFAPDIQEKMRRNGFPDFKPQITQQFLISDQSEATVKANSQTQFLFGNMDGTENYVLSANSFSFQTTHYPTFEKFLEQMVSGLKLIHEVIGLGFSERVGLRYLDAVIPTKSKSLTDYLVLETLGLWDKPPKKNYSVCEAFSQVANKCLTARVFIQNGPFSIPNDLVGTIPKLQPRFADCNGLHAILDNDAFLQERQLFDIEMIKKVFDELKEIVTLSFEGMLTADAQNYWNSEL